MCKCYVDGGEEPMTDQIKRKSFFRSQLPVIIFPYSSPDIQMMVFWIRSSEINYFLFIILCAVEDYAIEKLEKKDCYINLFEFLSRCRQECGMRKNECDMQY